MTSPRLSVVVPTRNRAADAAACVSSILANSRQDFELVVVDQSSENETEAALASFGSDPRFRYVKSALRGASRGRNEGVRVARAPLVAFTDDDCRVASDWVERILALFEADAAAGVVFGRVYVPPEVRGDGFAADFEPREREWQHRFPPVDVPWGISANMSVRREVLERIGPFDPLLGPGSPFFAAEDTDWVIRALAGGVKVVNASEISVTHLGVRHGDEASKLMRGYGQGVGATLLKHVRLRTPKSEGLLASWVLHFGTLGARRALRGEKPSGLGLVAAMLWGSVRATRLRLDASEHVYRAEA